MLSGLSSLEVSLSVQEPLRDLKLLGVLNNSYNSFDFIRSEFSSSLVEIHFRLFADDVSKTTSNTSDVGDGVHNLLSSNEICVQYTEHVLKFRSCHECRLSSGVGNSVSFSE